MYNKIIKIKGDVFMSKKYEVTNITIEFKERTLYRIRALKDFADVGAGD